MSYVLSLILGCTVAPRGIGIRGSGDPYTLCTSPQKLHQKSTGGKMTSYDYQLKIKAVEEYINSAKTLKQLANKYGVKDPKTIKEWVDKYNKFGENGLKKQKTITNYPTEIKQKVIQLKLTTNLTNREIANIYGIRDSSTVKEWYSKYKKGEVFEYIPDLKIKKENCIMKNKKPEELTLEEIKQLQEDLQKAQFEIDYLKTLRSLLLEEETSKNSKNMKKQD